MKTQAYPRLSGMVLGIVLATAAGMAAAAGVSADEFPAGRGPLLYETHCVSCHTSVAHLRQRHATSSAEIAREVTRWQANLGLNWSGQDVAEVVAYLDRRFYKLPKASTENGAGK